ncbi:MAG: HAD family hydrolase, partial [Verrucomicrobia bacterium]|nr:HAD family hydrolase [Verrucomicrobiota bacterium]
AIQEPTDLSKARAVFLDRDGTLMEDVGYCSRPGDVEIFPGIPGFLMQLKKADFKLVIITNQSGIGRGYFTEADFWAVQKELEDRLPAGLIDATYFCADRPETKSERRKPGPGMLHEAARDLNLDLRASYMMGDKSTDVEAGVRANVKGTILFSNLAENSSLRIGASLITTDLTQIAEFILADPETT